MQLRATRLHAARRKGLLRRLVDDQRMFAPRAENWLVAWEAEADRTGVEPGPEYWRQGYRWILERLPGSKRPPSPPV